jgi:hypothetical protein
VDPSIYRQAVLDDWLEPRAEPGVDFNLQMLNDESGDSMIRMSPLGITQLTAIDYYYEHVAFDETTGRFSPNAEFQDLSPSNIKQRAGD